MGMIAAPSSVRIGGITNNTAIALTQSGIWVCLSQQTEIPLHWNLTRFLYSNRAIGSGIPPVSGRNTTFDGNSINDRVLWVQKSSNFWCVPRILILIHSKCRAAYGNKAILARFTPAVYLEDALAELEVMPNGRELMDHILLSLLIIERKRLTPGRPETTKEIFN